MTLSFIPFLETFLLLLIVGTALAMVLLPEAKLALAIALGLPLGTFVNVCLVFAYTVTGIRLTLVTVFLGHLAIIAAIILLIYYRPLLLMDLEYLDKQPKPPLSRTQRTVIITSLILIAGNVAYSAVHAVWLPTVQYDSATNWTMRSEISFMDQRIAFDPTEARGMAKPQYPFLFHALQITANQGQSEWNDTAANSILLLLSLGVFLSLFLLLKNIRSQTHSLLTITAIVGIPLLGLHLAQGYGDLNLLQQFLLSGVCLAIWNERKKEPQWLLLSAVFVAASVWTKSEGTFFGLLPWCAAALLSMIHHREHRSMVASSLSTAIILSIPWHLFALAKGLLLTPHGSDATLAFHPEGLTEAFLGLFSRGSFGPLWYALALLIPVLLFCLFKKVRGTDRRQISLLFWGIFILLGFVFVYLFTPNVQFLLNAESYYRQMMVAGGVLVLASSCCLVLKE